MLAAGGGSDGSGTAAADTSELAAQLASKTSTIEALELELSRLKARLAASPGGESAQEPRPHGSHEEQVAALEAKLARAERAAAQAQTELADARRNLERAGAAAVREGSARTSAETARAAAEREVANLTEQRDEALRKADALEKKVAALNAVHRDADARLQATRREKERAERTALELREKLELVEAEVARLRKKLGEAHAGLDDEGLEEVEAETENPIRRRLEARIRDLERENHELRRGVWSQKRHELDGLAGGATTGDDLGSPGAGKFIDVDLGGGNSSGVRSPVGGGGGGVVDGLGQLLTSGINALAGVNNTGRPSNGVDDDDGFLSDDDIDFDEEAFRRAQEEEARQRLERIRETKRALANWRGWRLDVATARRSSAQFGGMSSMGVGEVFEV